MWAFESVFYHIYPLGFCCAPYENDGVYSNRLNKLLYWREHIKAIGANAVYFGPVFDSDRHGYDTRDYRKIDCRLGSNEDFANICKEYHNQGVKIVLDGVFNHVGRGFWAFQDVLKNRESSPYKYWFNINFGGNSNYNDGLWYEGWEGHYELVKLNLNNDEVVNHIFECIRGWVEEFDIDGLRLDVAYLLDKGFVSRLRSFCGGLKSDFFLVGEMLHGDYNQVVNDAMLHSCTNYECYKGLYSSFNSRNMFEITHSLLRQFGPDYWTLYKGKHLMCFADNHDVTRIASILDNKEHIKLLYGMLFAMPGIPCIYYGSEWGATGEKKDGDNALRPCFEKPQENDLSKFVSTLAKAHRESKALCYGNFRSLVLTNLQVVFERACNEGRVIVAVNADMNPYYVHINADAQGGVDLISGNSVSFEGNVQLPPYSVFYWKITS